SFKLVSGKERPRLVNARRQQRVLYFYFLDPELGLIHIRLATWFPFTVQVYVNGHSWLAQQMLKRRLGFEQHDNAFTALDDPQTAENLADSFVDQNWRKILLPNDRGGGLRTDRGRHWRSGSTQPPRADAADHAGLWGYMDG